jgi:hypothetical protein
VTRVTALLRIGAMTPGGQFEIQVDGKPRSYRDLRAVSIESAEFLKR